MKRPKKERQSVVDLVCQDSQFVDDPSVVELGANAAAGGVAEMAIAWRSAEQHAPLLCCVCV